MSAIYRTLRDLTGKAYTDDAGRNELLLTTFIEGLASSVVRWEVRKAKPAVVQDALSLALEMQSFLNLHGQQPDTPAASVNNLTSPSPSQSELSSHLIFTIKEEVKRVVGERSWPRCRNDAAVVNVPPAVDRNNRSRTTIRIKISAKLGTKTKEIAPIAEAIPPIEANRTIPRIE